MSVYNVWKGMQDCPYEEMWSLSKHSTIGCGGFAKMAYFPQSIDGCIAVLKRIHAQHAPYRVVGNMSNVLPASGISKCIFVCTKDMREMDIHRGFFAAGIVSGALLKACKAANKSGIEFLEGIPCTLGGALYMNAGVAGAYMQDVVKSVLVWDGFAIRELSLLDCDYAYKHSVFMQRNWTILGAWLHLQDAQESQIDERIRFYKKRRMHLPKAKSMGCIFKNLENRSAAQLIEGAGLKGLRLGGAIVSEVHANFILNDDCATSEQVKTLIEVVKNAVRAQYKMELEEEIEYLE